jgi:hypothetical protein
MAEETLNTTGQIYEKMYFEPLAKAGNFIKDKVTAGADHVYNEVIIPALSKQDIVIPEDYITSRNEIYSDIKIAIDKYELSFDTKIMKNKAIIEQLKKADSLVKDTFGITITSVPPTGKLKDKITNHIVPNYKADLNSILKEIYNISAKYKTVDDKAKKELINLAERLDSLTGLKDLKFDKKTGLPNKPADSLAFNLIFDSTSRHGADDIKKLVVYIRKFYKTVSKAVVALKKGDVNAAALKNVGTDNNPLVGYVKNKLVKRAGMESLDLDTFTIDEIDDLYTGLENDGVKLIEEFNLSDVEDIYYGLEKSKALIPNNVSSIVVSKQYLKQIDDVFNELSKVTKNKGVFNYATFFKDSDAKKILNKLDMVFSKEFNIVIVSKPGKLANKSSFYTDSTLALVLPNAVSKIMNTLALMKDKSSVEAIQFKNELVQTTHLRPPSPSHHRITGVPHKIYIEFFFENHKTYGDDIKLADLIGTGRYYHGPRIAEKIYRIIKDFYATVEKLTYSVSSGTESIGSTVSKEENLSDILDKDINMVPSITYYTMSFGNESLISKDAFNFVYELPAGFTSMVNKFNNVFNSSVNRLNIIKAESPHLKRIREINLKSLNDIQFYDVKDRPVPVPVGLDVSLKTLVTNIAEHRLEIANELPKLLKDINARLAKLLSNKDYKQKIQPSDIHSKDLQGSVTRLNKTIKSTINPKNYKDLQDVKTLIPNLSSLDNIIEVAIENAKYLDNNLIDSITVEVDLIKERVNFLYDDLVSTKKIEMSKSSLEELTIILEYSAKYVTSAVTLIYLNNQSLNLIYHLVDIIKK